jgi:phospholipid-binding lipoprotein MlaA
MKARLAHVMVCMAFAGLCGCVTLPPNAPRSPQDPYESFNRGVYRFNDALDRGVVKPLARGYNRVVPHPVRIGVANFFSNLETPTVMFNDALQGKLRASANDLGRFLMNTTIGVGGLLDPATRAGLDRNDADFGQTLGVWGLHAGPFLELPLFGPSDIRDLPGKVVDTYTNPKQYVHNTYVKYGLSGVSLLNTRAALLSYDDTLKNVYDPYAFIRDAYLQHRAYKTGQSAGDDAPLVDPDAPAPVPAQSPPPAP